MSDGILLSDWVTEEEFNYSPTGELSAVIALAKERRDWFRKGEQAAEERIIKLLEADLLRFMYWDDDSSYAKGINLTGFIALIKGEK